MVLRTVDRYRYGVQQQRIAIVATRQHGGRIGLELQLARPFDRGSLRMDDNALACLFEGFPRSDVRELSC